LGYLDGQPEGLSASRTSATDGRLGDCEEESFETPLPTIDVEEVLPDDSSLTYIGMEN
jgi:hypothetical protein